MHCHQPWHHHHVCTPQPLVSGQTELLCPPPQAVPVVNEVVELSPIRAHLAGYGTRPLSEFKLHVAPPSLCAGSVPHPRSMPESTEDTRGSGPPHPPERGGLGSTNCSSAAMSLFSLLTALTLGGGSPPGLPEALQSLLLGDLEAGLHSF